jgi:hypothetical protein
MKFIGFISQYKDEDTDVYYWYFFQENRLSVEVFKGSKSSFLKMYNDNKATIIVTLCENFLSMESQMTFPGEKNISHKENIKRIKDFISWSLKQNKKEKILEKTIPCIKAMKLIYEEFSNHNDKIKLLFIAKSMHSIIKEELQFKN